MSTINSERAMSVHLDPPCSRADQSELFRSLFPSAAMWLDHERLRAEIHRLHNCIKAGVAYGWELRRYAHLVAFAMNFNRKDLL